MSKDIFFIREEFSSWLTDKENNKSGVISASSVKDYLKQDRYKIQGQKFLYMDVIVSFICNGDTAYAYTIVDEWEKEIRSKYTGGTLDKRISYLRKFKDFIRTYDFTSWEGKTNLIEETILNDIKKQYNKSDLYKIEAMDSLIKVTGGEELFIKLAIESSYFFDPIAANKRHNQIASFINDIYNACLDYENQDYGLFEKDGEALPARKSQTNKNSIDSKKLEGWHDPVNNILYYFDEKIKKPICPISTDGNGNARVCQLINKNFGYNLALKGKDKPFKNFIISHIWGRAIDPRFFTNLWNIVIVPAWANHLLDKDAEEGSLASRFKATMMKLCIIHYGLSKYNNWGMAKMSHPDIVNECDLLKGEYKIQVIKRLTEEQPFDKFVSSIVTQNIQIK